MKPVLPYLTFYGNANDAAAFYEKTFGLKNKETHKYGEGKFPSPPEAAEYIMHCHLSNDNFELMLADSLNPGESGTSNVALMISCDSEEEINHLYTGLLNGGEAVMELQDTFWGATYAKVRDQFGYTWDLNFEKAK